MSMTMTINPLPARTWRWLKMNDTSVRWPEPSTFAGAHFTGPAQLGAPELPADLETGCGPGVSALFASGQAIRVTAREPGNPQTARISLSAGAGESSAQTVEISVAENCALTVLMDYTVREGALAVSTKFNLAAGAKLRLVQIQMTSPKARFLNDIGGLCGANAEFELLQAFPGAVYSGCTVRLEGDGSAFRADIGYLGRADERLDMNYVARHAGRNTVCEINANGALWDGASKIFRGTIDFIRGAAGASGDEREKVLLLGDDVVNQTIPLILCAEEDVAGNHGATIGRLDEDTLSYFATRGIPEELAGELLANAILESLLNKIGDDAIAQELRNFMKESEDA